jgi:hypothetical protein
MTRHPHSTHHDSLPLSPADEAELTALIDARANVEDGWQDLMTNRRGPRRPGRPPSRTEPPTRFTCTRSATMAAPSAASRRP